MGNFILGFFIGGFFGTLLMGILSASKDDIVGEKISTNVTVIMGKTASGKDAIVNKLVSEYGFKKLITYTSRPMREGEIQDVTYHFIDGAEFRKKIKDGFFAEWKTYETEEGTWYYGTALEDLENADKDTLVILTPAGYRDIIRRLNVRPNSIYICANNRTIKERLRVRGDNPSEAKRRLKHDNKDFKGVQRMADKVVFNNAGTDINDVVDRIIYWLKYE